MPLVSGAQNTAVVREVSRDARQAVPFVVGEELTYRATFGKIRAGTARMRVDGIEMERGRPA